MNDRPWMTALEMQFAALKGNALNVTQQKKISDEERAAYLTIQSGLRRAQSYAWSDECSTAVRVAAKTVPMDSSWSLSSLPDNYGWWWFGRDELAAMLFGTQSDGWLYLLAFGKADDIAWPVPYMWVSWPPNVSLRQLNDDHEYGSLCAVSVDGAVVERVPTESAKDRIDIARTFVAACAWLQQRVVTLSAGPIERHRRKQLAREHDAPLPSDVKVIQLRRTESQPHQTSADAEHVDWSCRWIVNGHWRNQPYKDERKLIYIMPHVKGPSDMPLKVPTHTVYQVSR